jgi:conjugal transfer pilus assembly protein TraE
MNIDNLSQSVADLRKSNRRLTLGVACIGAAMLLLAIKMMFTNVAIINRVPGMPDGARIERNGMDVGAKQATAYAVTNAIASLNPSNGDSVKSVLQPFLSSDAYTKVTQAIDLKVATLKAQRELGSYYFVLRGFEADDKLGRVFVKGELHTVNAAKDTSELYVFEYPVRFADYKMIFDDVIAYPGDKAHNSQWIEAQKKK